MGTKKEIPDDNETLGVVLGMQHTPVDMTLGHTKVLYAGGVRFMSLAYDKATEYCGGCKEDGPLTERGKMMLEWMDTAGITLDVSHMGHAAIRGAIEFIKRQHLIMKPLASHSGCFAIYEHPRNLPDDILRDIVDLGGYIGIPAWSPIIAKEGRSPFLTMGDHIEHALKVCRQHAVGIGADIPLEDMTVEDARAHYRMMMTKVSPTEAYFPDRAMELINCGNEAHRVIADRVLFRFNPSLQEGISGKNFRMYLEWAWA